MNVEHLVYLATPYSHDDPDVRARRFHKVNAVAAEMMRQGVHVYSPVSHGHPIALAGDLPKGWDFWQQHCRTMMSICGKMVVLMEEGWRESLGVQAEIAIAREMQVPVEFIESFSGRIEYDE